MILHVKVEISLKKEFSDLDLFLFDLSQFSSVGRALDL